MFENVDGRTPDAGVTGILIAHLGAFGSGELKSTCQTPQLCWICRSNHELKRRAINCNVSDGLCALDHQK